MKELAVRLVQLVPAVDREEINLGTLGEVDLLVNDQSTVLNSSFQRRHGCEDSQKQRRRATTAKSLGLATFRLS